MSASDSSSTPVAARTLPLCGYLPNPFERVRVEIRPSLYGDLCFCYRGLPEDIVAAGAATPKQLQPGRRGVKRFDADGDAFRVLRPSRVQWIEIHQYKSFERAETMPGFESWMIEAAKEPPASAAPKARSAAVDESDKLSPDDWRASELRSLDVFMQMLSCLSDHGDGHRFLKAGFRLNGADEEAYRARVDRAYQDLAALLRTMRIERISVPRIRLAVDNTRPGAKP